MISSYTNYIIAAVLEALSAVAGVGNWGVVSVRDSSFRHRFSSSGKTVVVLGRCKEWFSV